MYSHLVSSPALSHGLNMGGSNPDAVSNRFLDTKTLTLVILKYADGKRTKKKIVEKVLTDPGMDDILQGLGKPSTVHVFNLNSSTKPVSTVETFVEDVVEASLNGVPFDSSGRVLLTDQEAKSLLMSKDVPASPSALLPRQLTSNLSTLSPFGNVGASAGNGSNSQMIESLAPAISSTTTFLEKFALEKEVIEALGDSQVLTGLVRAAANFLSVYSSRSTVSRHQMASSIYQMGGYNMPPGSGMLPFSNFSTNPGSLRGITGAVTNQQKHPLSAILGAASNELKQLKRNQQNDHSENHESAASRKRARKPEKKMKEESGENESAGKKAKQGNKKAQADEKDAKISGLEPEEGGFSGLRNPSALSLKGHIKFVELLEKHMTLNDRRDRDWNAFKRLVMAHPECVTKHSKQKAKRILEERRNRNHLRFWEQLKSRTGVEQVKNDIRDMLGPEHFEEEFVDVLGTHVWNSIRSGKRAPGSILDWEEPVKGMVLKKLLHLHINVYPQQPLSNVYKHFVDLLSRADMEVSILSVCTCEICTNDWKLNDIPRGNLPALLLHWTKHKAAMFREVLQLHEKYEDDIYRHIVGQNKHKMRYWSKDEIDTALRSAHATENCPICYKIARKEGRLLPLSRTYPKKKKKEDVAIEREKNAMRTGMPVSITKAQVVQLGL